MKKNINAQGLLSESQSILGPNTTFIDAYGSAVKSLNLTVQATPVGFGKAATYSYSVERPPGEYCPCPNMNCSGGGFQIGYFLYRLISERKTEGEISGSCVGGEKIGRSSRSCYYRFKAIAEIEYNEDGAEDNSIMPR